MATDNKKTCTRLFHPVRLPPALSSSILHEVGRLLWIAGSVALLLALWSYSPRDPSWSTWSSRTLFENWMGRSGSAVSDLLLQLFGMGAYGICLLILASSFFRGPSVEKNPIWFRLLSPLIFIVSFSAVLACLFPAYWLPDRLSLPGGMVGALFSEALIFLAGPLGGTCLSLVFFLGVFIVEFQVPLVTWCRRALTRSLRWARHQGGLKWKELTDSRRQASAPAPSHSLAKLPLVPALPAEKSCALSAGASVSFAHSSPLLPPMSTERSEEDEELFRMLTPKPLKLSKEAPKHSAVSDFSEYRLPALDLLSGKAESKVLAVDRSWYLEKGNILVQKLKDFGVEGEVVHISPGPVITVYEFKPASGVKIKEIANLSDDLTLALSVLSVRIVAPIPGKPVVGIEIPSPHRETVFFKDLIEETPFYNEDFKIPIVLGRLASGEPVVAGLGTMPHLLVAGSTGTGKSVFINTLICSLLFRYKPQELKLILVDPKMVELSTYESVPHLLLPVVVDSKKAAMALRWTVEEMERRYSLMHKYGVRHLDAYNARIRESVEKGNAEDANDTHLPYIVVVIDEYADLMAVVPKDVELSIARLAQKARASGIHLVLATQRPSTDVVTGTIKANFPSRLSFRVASSIDSKTILDRTGAERLLGNGDMLFHSAGFTTLKRLQGAFIADADLERVVDFLKAQGEPEFDERLLAVQDSDEEGLAESDGPEEGGRLYDSAVRLVSDKGEASISLIQRHLKIGYNRAASLMEEMEKQGIVAPASGASKRRAVLINSI